MANVPLKSIKFHGLSYTYTIPQVDATLTKSGDAADAQKVGEEISDVKSAISDLVSALKSDLIPILRAGVYSSDQSDNIDDLEDDLETLAPTPVSPITPSQSGGTLTLSGFIASPSWNI